jgi:uncharacterized membrane protein
MTPDSGPPSPGSSPPPPGESRSAGKRSDPERLEAFSDGVMAVIITIMVLDLRSPASASVHELSKSLPGVLVYALSFVFIGIYWNNHHHLLRSTERISARVMWSNLHLLFWLSLMPVVTRWVAEFYKSHLPACVYGIVAIGAAIAYTILVRAILAANGTDSEVARAIGSDFKGKISIVIYASGAALSWVSPWIAYAAYVIVAIIWFVPDRRLARGAEPT